MAAMADERPNPWAQGGGFAPQPETDLELTRQRPPYDVSGYAPAPPPPWTPPAAAQPYPTGVPSFPYTPPPAAQATDAGFKQLLDFEFRGYATPTLVKVVYVLSVVGAGLLWLFWVVTGFSVGLANPFGRANPTAGVVALLFGWIPAVLIVAYTRFLLEFFLANIRTATRMEDIDAKLARLAERRDDTPAG